jgi:2-dehydro-3-deoxyphosphogluconate aldolase / (4S)-4-hydroxy-2-oxoglutarate aldolase
MSGRSTVERLAQATVVAVIRAPTAAGALSAADAVVEGGLCGLEITYSTPEPAEVIRELRARYEDRIVLGAGTVRAAAEVDPVVGAGAEFVVSPGTSAEVVEAARRQSVLALPGVFTPTEVMRAHELGCETVKLFPATVGGVALLRSLRDPFPDTEFIPTGGVTPENVGEWLAAGALAVAAGGSLCPAEDIAADRFDAIRERARRFAAQRPGGR